MAIRDMLFSLALFLRGFAEKAKASGEIGLAGELVGGKIGCAANFFWGEIELAGKLFEIISIKGASPIPGSVQNRHGCGVRRDSFGR